ncbi:MAG TPA: 50S ribosomal protein L29 [Planctomycetota bacterium]|nr:50S ribosomal protein L29 [Planctomycetota bacterium]
MRAREMRGLSTEELRRELEKRTRDVFNLRFRAQTQKLDDPSEMKKARRDVARMKTILRERELEAAGR